MATMIKFHRESDFIAIDVINREWKIRDVWVSQPKLIKFLQECDGELICNDAYDYIRFTVHDDMVMIRITHVVPKYDGRIDGRQADLYVPWDTMWYIVSNGRKASVLSHEYGGRPEIFFTEQAQERIGSLEPRYKRALSKFMRDAFQWPRSKCITIFSDYIKGSFYFSEERRDDCSGICGGIILSDYNGKACYSMHT